MLISDAPYQCASCVSPVWVVKRVTTGTINTEITWEIVHRVQLTSMITRVSAEELELSEGREAYAVIKSNDIVITKD